MPSKILRYGCLIFIVTMTSYCNAGDIDLKSMESPEIAFEERQSEERIAFMSLETMFPNQQVRDLAEAAGKGELKQIEQLVAQGIDINSRGTKNVTPLFWAMRNINGFEELLELGADPNLIFADSSVMHWAARHKNVNFLRLALIHGGDPNLVAGKLGETPIFKTIGVMGSDNEAAMLMLLNSGADINATTASERIFGMAMGGKTPVMIAAELGRFDTVYELLNRGASYESKDDSGRDLKDRVVSMNGRYVAGSQQYIFLNKVIVWLEARGVKIS